MRVPGWIKEQDNLAKRASIVVTNPTDETNYPVRNLIALPVSKPTRFNNRGTNKIYCTFNGPTSIDFAALVGHNLSSSATITLRAGATYDAATFSQAITWRRRTAFLHLPAAQNYKYWSFQLVDAANSYGYFEIGYLILGVLTVPAFGFGADWPWLDRMVQLVSETETGTPDIRALTERQAFSLQFAQLSGLELGTLQSLFLDQAGAARPLFFVPDTTVNEGVFGRFNQEELERLNASPAGKGAEVTLLEDPAGLIVEAAMPIFRSGEALPAGATFARTGTAWYKNSDLALVEAATGTLRDPHYWDYGIHAMLLEPARTNAWDYSEDLTQASYVKNSATISVNAAAEPKAVPGTTADKLVEAADVGQQHFVYRALAACTDDTVQSLSCFVKAAERTWILVMVVLKDGTNRYFNLHLTDGSIGATSAMTLGTDFWIERYANGWWRIIVAKSVLAGAIPANFRVYLATADNVTFYDGDGASGIYLWGFQHEVDKAWSSSYVPTGAATASRNIDRLEMSWTHGAQPMTVYCDLIEAGSKWTPDGRAVQIGSTINVMLFFYNGNYYVGNEHSAVIVSGVSLGHILELRAVLSPAGCLRLGISDEGAAEGLSAENPAHSFDSYNPPILALAAIPGGTVPSILLARALKFYRGNQSLDFMRKL